MFEALTANILAKRVADSLQMMFNGEIAHDHAAAVGLPRVAEGRVVTVHLAGTPDYIISLQASREGGIALACAMFECAPEAAQSSEIDDAMRELINMVSGQVRAAIARNHKIEPPVFLADDEAIKCSEVSIGARVTLGVAAAWLDLAVVKIIPGTSVDAMRAVADPVPIAPQVAAEPPPTPSTPTSNEGSVSSADVSSADVSPTTVVAPPEPPPVIPSDSAETRAASPTSASVTAAQTKTQPARPLRMDIAVLIAADESADLEFIKSAVGMAAMSVVCATRDGNEALAAARRHKPDIVCLDFKLAGLSGIDVLTAIRKELPNTIVEIVTASATAQNVRSALQLRVNGIVTRPYSAERIVADIDRALAGRKGKTTATAPSKVA